VHSVQPSVERRANSTRVVTELTGTQARTPAADAGYMETGLETESTAPPPELRTTTSTALESVSVSLAFLCNSFFSAVEMLPFVELTWCTLHVELEVFTIMRYKNLYINPGASFRVKGAGGGLRIP